MTELEVRRPKFDFTEAVPWNWNPSNPAFSLSMNATSMIQLNVGGNLVTIDATGVTVFGTLTKVNCPGSVARPVPPIPPVPPADGILAGSNTLKPDDPDPADGAVSGITSAPQNS